MKEFSTNLTLQVEDWTGRMEVNLWINADAASGADRRDQYRLLLFLKHYVGGSLLIQSAQGG